MNFEPLRNQVLVERTPNQSGIIWTSEKVSGTEMVQAEGVILAVGPGHYDEDGDFCPTTVKPGQKVLFNARWNDFCHQELRGTDCDGKGPLERPLPQFLWGEKLYLITEGDIAGILDASV